LEKSVSSIIVCWTKTRQILWRHHDPLAQWR